LESPVTHKREKQLIGPDELAKAIHLDKVGLESLGSVLSTVMGLDKVNEVYARFGNHQGVDFINEVLKHFEVNITYFEEELKRIPKTGPFITVSNHPLGGLDGLVLIKLVSMVRPDYKVMANFLLQKIEPISDHFFGVNPFENAKDAKSSTLGIKQAFEHLRDGGCVGMFPAGEVSTYHLNEGKILDREWIDGAIKMVAKAKVPVVPIFFGARNSRLFYLLSALSPMLRTASLPREVVNSRNKSVKVRIGRAIHAEEYLQHPAIEDMKHFLRKRTYALGLGLEEEKKPMLPKNLLKASKAIEPIGAPADPALMAAEVNRLNKQEHQMLVNRELEVYIAEAHLIPNIVQEIGRLREETFRFVGEGTNKAYDLDAYDQDYHHLFLWHSEEKRVLGAYRLGLGRKLFEQSGISGFYVSTLFRVAPEAYPFFRQSIEMGRAFIVKDYQTKPMPLFLLWQGIIRFFLNNPDHRYLTGCVSISNSFSHISKSLIISFVKKYYVDHNLAKYIKPRKEFRVNMDELKTELLNSSTDLKKLDRLVEELEPGATKVPVLLKKYIQQNARIATFSVDPKFNNSIDGFMYINIDDLPEQTVKPVLEKLQEEARKLDQNPSGQA
jgi:putative hemolysin